MRISGVAQYGYNQAAVREGIQGQSCNGSTTGQSRQVYMVRVCYQITDEVLNNNRHCQADTSGAGTGYTCQTSYSNNRCDDRVAECIYQQAAQGCVCRNHLYNRTEAYDRCGIEQGGYTTHSTIAHHLPEALKIEALEEQDNCCQNTN